MASNSGQAPIHSTGRGGQGNIGPDPTIYTDGSIVREGFEGPHRGDLEYSTGVGGAGNIDGTRAKQGQTESFGAGVGAGANSRLDEDDYVPEPAMREKTDNYSNYHTGRGGQGNVHKDKYGGHSSQKEQEQAERNAGTNTSTHGGDGGVIDKVKGIIHSHTHHHKAEDKN